MMAQTKDTGRAVVLAALMLAGPVAADSVDYTGSGNFIADQDLMPLASGDAVVLGTAQGVVALSTDPPSIMDVRCSGMGLAKQDGDFGSVLYCAFTDPIDKLQGFDVKGIERGDTTTLEVVGGSGRWADASGAGTLRKTHEWSNGGAVTFELTITTP